MRLILKLEDFVGDWIQKEGEWDVARIEFRLKGRKPLVLENPSLSRLVFSFSGYMGLPLPIAEHHLITWLLDTPEPPTLEDRFYARMTIEGLEKITP